MSTIKRGTHKQTTSHLLKNDSTETEEEALGRFDCPGYQNFENINDAYCKIIQKVNGLIDLIAHIKSRRIK